MSNPACFECDLAGRKLVIETGKLAGQASGEVTVRYRDTVILATCVVSSEEREDTDFVPLTIDYEERLYAAGKIPGGFIRREGRPSQDAVLAGRLTDRSLRPLLPKEWRRDIQIIITVLSADQENDPDVLSIIGSSAALCLSEVPFFGPVAACRVGYMSGELVLNPTLPQMGESQLDLVVASTKEKVVMLEMGGREVPEPIVLQAIKFGHEANQEIIRLEERLQQEHGRVKLPEPESKSNPELIAAMDSLGDKISECLDAANKNERGLGLGCLKDEAVKKLCEKFTESEIAHALDKKTKERLREKVLRQGLRVSRRGLTELRPITCEVGLLPRTHGSALFTRGETQVLTITTLGSIREEQQLEGLGLEETKRYMHHYNMPPFSTGEVKRLGTPGRREIGHGALAERSLLPVIPDEASFPYTIRLVSEVLSSSGSTSMGSACASSLSLMDAGIPIKCAVAGIAIGLVTDEAGNYAVLTDIEGIEDNFGDMDFKVAGTVEGITAIQVDTKIRGLSMEIIEKALSQAKDARLQILDVMQKAISQARPEISRFAPRMYKIKINPDKIGAVIGTGGKTIRAISEETKATIDIENDGTVIIGTPDEASAKKTIKIIEGLTKEIEVGEVYTGKVTRIMNFGAMVEILPGKEGLVHVSELADYRVGRVEDIVKVGDEVTVQVIEIDNLGRVNLSRKALLAKTNPPASGSPQEGTAVRPPQNSRFPPRPRPPQERRPYHQ
ncbi:MAG: polyribonucleotide nucleotidyltransferase [Chloroflexota bacterium]